MGIVSGESIVKARQLRGISAAELARQVGVTRGFISLLEKNATHISLQRLNMIAAVLGVSIADLGFKDEEVSVCEPEWMKYLAGKFNLSDDDRRELLKIVSRVGIPANLPDETRREFRIRWEDFYQTVSIFLPNASTKMLRHPSVLPFVKCLNVALAESATWDVVFEAFDRLIAKIILDDENFQCNGSDWLAFVCKKLKILRESDCLHGGVDFFSRQDMMALKSFVQSSKRIYGSVIKSLAGAAYIYIENAGEKLFNRGDFPVWHEVVRVMIDPELKIKTGAYYYPDGEDRPPLEFVISRLAARLACWPYREKWAKLDGMITPIKVQEFIKGVYPNLPWRVAYVGLLDFCESPSVYVDCYKRLKRNQLKEKKIAMENVAAMAADGDAKLRIGFVFRNLAAEKTAFELRHNLRVPTVSTISKAMAAPVEKVIEGDDDLSQWDVGYDLKGIAKVFAVQQIGTFGEPHVRAVMQIRG